MYKIDQYRRYLFSYMKLSVFGMPKKVTDLRLQ